MDAQILRQQVQAFIRTFGLLDQSRTPCGRDIPPSQAHALQILGLSAEITQKSLTDELHLDKSTTSRLVTQLVERGWVDRTPNPQDRREIHLELTAQGRQVLNQVSASALDHYARLWDHLPPEKRPQVIESLQLLTQAIKEMK